MIKLHLIFILLSLLPGKAAQAANACQNLSEFACTEGTYNDGTGSVTVPRSTHLTEVHRKYLDLSIPEFEKIFQSPQNANFRNLAIEALGEDQASCMVSSASDVRACNQILSSRLGDLLILSPSNSSFSSVFNDEKLYDLTNSPLFLDVAVKTNAEIRKGYPVQERLSKIRNKTLPGIKKQMAARIASLPLDEATKEVMTRKIQQVQLDENDCSAPQASTNTLTMLNENFYPNGFYSSTTNSLQICQGFLTDPYSEFAVARVIAHELAHSIDPCHIAVGNAENSIKYSSYGSFDVVNKEYPLKELVSCLRGSKSAKAQINPSALQNHPHSHNDVCINDQAGEAVADWFATEVMVNHLHEEHPHLTNEQWQKGISNSFRVFCGNTHSEGFSVHPSDSIRIDNILGANPAIRAKMGCSNTPTNATYCDGTAATSIGTTRPVARPVTRPEGPSPSTEKRPRARPVDRTGTQ